MNKNIAIDGPAGAGKSTIARAVARELEFIYVDTGAMYRAIALFFLNNGIDLRDEEAVKKACEAVDVRIAYDGGEQQVILNGENVSSDIRTPEVSAMASRSSALPQVRAKLLDLQKDLAADNNVIMDGRDIGTCVLPNADLKIYLTASVETRAKRRYDEMLEKKMQADYDEVIEDIKKRDHQDMTREISPLKQAEDAVLVDSSNMSIDEVKAEIIRLFKERV